MLDTMFEQLGMQTQTGHELMSIIAQKDAEIEAWRKAQAQINAELLEARETIAAFRDAQDSLNTQIDDVLIDLYEMRRLFGCANAAKRGYRKEARALGEYVRRLDFEKGGLIQSIDARD